ncbi:MAG: zinc metallopeptidase [Planctomycetota bacterium]
MPLFFTMLDPLYWVFFGAGLLISLGASALVKSAYAKYAGIPSTRGYTGAEAARTILAGNDIHDVHIEPVEGYLSDHYDPSRKVLRLSPKNFYGDSIAAIGIAAHEAGHAVQHARSYAPMALRSALVPLANLGSQLGIIILMIGFFMSALGLIKIGILLYSGLLLFQVVTLPVELNASSRAKRALADSGITADASELRGVSSVLNAAAFTYVAAAVTTLLTLLYFMLRSGMLGGRDD